MKRFITHLLFLAWLPACCLAQETTIIKRRLTGSVKEKITVLKSDINIRYGLYQALLDSKTVLASGAYINNEKKGSWNFFDTRNHLIQRFDYTHNKLLFEAVEDSTSNCRYVVDRALKDTDRTTKPVIRGGRFYGYMSYLRLFRLPDDMRNINMEVVVPAIELLVSPGGRLADYTVHFQGPGGYDRKIRFKIDLLPEEDKIFIPATINGEPVACRIFVRCFLNNSSQLELY